jgi:hypothetical protein
MPSPILAANDSEEDPLVTTAAATAEDGASAPEDVGLQVSPALETRASATDVEGWMEAARPPAAGAEVGTINTVSLYKSKVLISGSCPILVLTTFILLWVADVR